MMATVVAALCTVAPTALASSALRGEAAPLTQVAVVSLDDGLSATEALDQLGLGDEEQDALGELGIDIVPDDFPVGEALTGSAVARWASFQHVWFVTVASSVDWSTDGSGPGPGDPGVGTEDTTTTSSSTVDPSDDEFDGTGSDETAGEPPVPGRQPASPVCAADGSGVGAGVAPSTTEDLGNLWAELQPLPAVLHVLCGPEVLATVLGSLLAEEEGAGVRTDAGPLAVGADGASIPLDLPEGVDLDAAWIERPDLLVTAGAPAPKAVDGIDDGVASSVELVLHRGVPEFDAAPVEIRTRLRLRGTEVTWEPIEVTVDVEGWSAPATNGQAPIDLSGGTVKVDTTAGGGGRSGLLLGVVLGSIMGAALMWLVGRRRPELVTGAAPRSGVISGRVAAAPVAPGAGVVSAATVAVDPAPDPSGVGALAPTDPAVPVVEDASEEAPGGEPVPEVSEIDLVPVGLPPTVGDKAGWMVALPTIRVGEAMEHAPNIHHLVPTPGPVAGSQVWASTPGSPPVLGVYTEKKPELGEDAEPSFLRRLASHRRKDDQRPTFIAVYDGLGGSGSGQVDLQSGGSRSQAYLASRLVREATERFMIQRGDSAGWGNTDRLAEDLADAIHAHLDHWTGMLPASRSKIRSKMQAPFPTTFAAAVVERAGRSHRVSTIWAGDSRVYLFTKEKGLQQLSADHTRDADILGQLVEDGPMTRKISANRDWAFDVATIDVNTRFAVVCSSDGVHGYVRTPGGVELELARAAVSAASTKDWGEQLANRISQYTGDDATLALAACGFRSFDDLRAAFAGRLNWLVESQDAPFERIDVADPEAVRACRARCWDEYRDDYTAKLVERGALLIPSVPS